MQRYVKRVAIEMYNSFESGYPSRSDTFSVLFGHISDRQLAMLCVAFTLKAFVGGG
jgi:hypothetical protein